MNPIRRIRLVALLSIAACGGEESYEIEEVRETRQGGPLPPPVSTAERFGRTAAHGSPHGSTLPGSPPPSPTSFVYQLPEGWEKLPPAQFREVNFRVRGSAETDCYVSVLPGGGGGLLANANRWRQQMGQPPLDEAAFAALPRKPFLGGEGHFLDLSGDYTGMGREARTGFRLLGLVRETPGQLVSFKLVGPESVVGGEVEAFLAVAASLRSETPKPPSEAAALRWDAPEGWVQQPERGAMRLVTFAPAGDPTTECYVTVMAGEAGGVVANVNFWRDQMGQPPMPEAEVAKLPTVEVLGRAAPLVEVEGGFTGKQGGRIEKAALLGTICLVGDRTVFVKMTGPADTVKREKDRFVAFCKSLR